MPLFPILFGTGLLLGLLELESDSYAPILPVIPRMGRKVQAPLVGASQGLTEQVVKMQWGYLLEDICLKLADRGTGPSPAADHPME